MQITWEINSETLEKHTPLLNEHQVVTPFSMT